MLGLARVATATGQTTGPVATFVADYFRHHDGTPRIVMPDHCAPALAAAAARDLIGDAAARRAVAPVAEFLRTQPRNRLGALDHLGHGTALAALYPKSIWIDSLMMYALPAALAGAWLPDPALADFGHRQPALFARALQDPYTGLFRHAYLYERGRARPRAPVFWLRGNGWVACALVDMLQHRRDARNLALLQTLAAALLEHQRADGSWTTVLDDSQTYVESSGTALVGYALAKGARLGLIPATAHDAGVRAMDALRARLRSKRDGLSLAGISGPTIPSSRAGYASVPRRSDIDYGVGAFLMLAVELSNQNSMHPMTKSCDYPK